MKTLDSKTIYEVLPNLPMKKFHSTCKICSKEMQILGELTTIMWNDYLDGSGESIDLCESHAKFMVGKIKEALKSGK